MKIKFEIEKETKGAVRYKEIGEDPVIGTLYIRKSHLKELGIEEAKVIVVEVRREKDESDN